MSLTYCEWSLSTPSSLCYFIFQRGSKKDTRRNTLMAWWQWHVGRSPSPSSTSHPQQLATLYLLHITNEINRFSVNFFSFFLSRFWPGLNCGVVVRWATQKGVPSAVPTTERKEKKTCCCRACWWKQHHDRVKVEKNKRGEIDREMSFIDFTDLFLRLDGNDSASVQCSCFPQSSNQSTSSKQRHPPSWTVTRAISRLKSRWMSQRFINAFLFFLVADIDTGKPNERERGIRDWVDVVRCCFHEGSFNRIGQIETVETVQWT